LLAQKLIQMLNDVVYSNDYTQGTVKTVMSMNNETLKEYLLPEIQIPYIPLVLKDHYAPVEHDLVITTDRSVQPLQTNLERIFSKIQGEMSIQQYNCEVVDSDAFSDEQHLVHRDDIRYPLDFIDVAEGRLLYTKDRAYPIPAMLGDLQNAFAPCWQWNGKKVGVLVANDDDKI
jgi:hypothetical protein